MQFAVRTLIAIMLACVAMADLPALGNYSLSNLIVHSPFQAFPTSTSNSSVSFIFHDSNTPAARPVRCHAEWKVGLQPPVRSAYCEDPWVRIMFPRETYNGVQNLTIALSHSYEKFTLGEYPFSMRTNFGEVHLTYPGTPNYECDIKKAHCISCEGTTINVHVTRVIA